MDEEQQREPADLVSRLLALITTKLEHGSAVVADCVERRASEELRQREEWLEHVAEKFSNFFLQLFVLSVVAAQRSQSSRTQRNASTQGLRDRVCQPGRPGEAQIVVG